MNNNDDLLISMVILLSCLFYSCHAENYYRSKHYDGSNLVDWECKMAIRKNNLNLVYLQFNDQQFEQCTCTFSVDNGDTFLELRSKNNSVIEHFETGRLNMTLTNKLQNQNEIIIIHSTFSYNISQTESENKFISVEPVDKKAKISMNCKSGDYLPTQSTVQTTALPLITTTTTTSTKSVTTASTSQLGKASNSWIIYVICGVVVLIVLIITVICIIVIRKRCNRNKEGNEARDSKAVYYTISQNENHNDDHVDPLPQFNHNKSQEEPKYDNAKNNNISSNQSSTLKAQSDKRNPTYDNAIHAGSSGPEASGDAGTTYADIDPTSLVTKTPQPQPTSEDDDTKLTYADLSLHERPYQNVTTVDDNSEGVTTDMDHYEDHDISKLYAKPIKKK